MSIPNPAPWGRYAEPGERCTCGRPAVVVWKTERFGEVGDCGIRDGGADAGQDAAEESR